MRFVAGVVAAVVLGAVVLFGGAYEAFLWQCRGEGRAMALPVKAVNGSCYLQVDGRWYLDSQIRTITPQPRESHG